MDEIKAKQEIEKCNSLINQIYDKFANQVNGAFDHYDHPDPEFEFNRYDLDSELADTKDKYINVVKNVAAHEFFDGMDLKDITNIVENAFDKDDPINSKKDELRGIYPKRFVRDMTVEAIEKRIYIEASHGSSRDELSKIAEKLKGITPPVNTKKIIENALIAKKEYNIYLPSKGIAYPDLNRDLTKNFENNDLDQSVDIMLECIVKSPNDKDQELDGIYPWDVNNDYEAIPCEVIDWHEKEVNQAIVNAFDRADIDNIKENASYALTSDSKQYAENIIKIARDKDIDLGEKTPEQPKKVDFQKMLNQMEKEAHKPTTKSAPAKTKGKDMEPGD